MNRRPTKYYRIIKPDGQVIKFKSISKHEDSRLYCQLKNGEEILDDVLCSTYTEIIEISKVEFNSD